MLLGVQSTGHVAQNPKVGVFVQAVKGMQVRARAWTSEQRLIKRSRAIGPVGFGWLEAVNRILTLGFFVPRCFNPVRIFSRVAAFASSHFEGPG